MNILYICNRFYPALARTETRVFNIAKRFASKKYSVHFACFDKGTLRNSFFEDKHGGRVKNIVCKQGKTWSGIHVRLKPLIIYKYLFERKKN